MVEHITSLSEVGITRYHRPDKEYTKIRNDFARNAKISLRAFRIASYVLSHADGFVQTQQQIARACGLSVSTVRKAMTDLTEDRYVVARRIREGGRWVGTAYAISDVPFTDQELATLSPPCAQCECSECECTESAPHKKITSSKKISNPEKINPSGGSSADAAAPTLEPDPTPTHSEETPVVAPVAQDALFDVPAEKTARKRDEGPSARTVVAAYVDSYRKHHAGADPSKAFLGRVARSAKAALKSGAAAPDELTAAAGTMGEGPYANLDVALSIFRQGGRKRVQTSSPALPHTDPAWVAVAQQVDSDTYQRLLVDDELVQWMAGDQSEVDKWVSRHPELASRFAAVA